MISDLVGPEDPDELDRQESQEDDEGPRLIGSARYGANSEHAELRGLTNRTFERIALNFYCRQIEDEFAIEIYSEFLDIGEKPDDQVYNSDIFPTIERESKRILKQK